MSRPKPRWRGRLALGASAALAILAGPAAAGAMADPGALYSQTNDPAGNVVQKFDRGAGGELSPAGAYSTGGAGLAALGGRQGAVELSDDESTVYAVNAGSNSVSVLRVTKGGLELEDVVASGGTAPAERRRAQRPRVGAQLGRHAERRRRSARPAARSSRSPAAPGISPARWAPRRSRPLPTGRASSSPSGSPTGLRRSRSTAPGAPAHRSPRRRAAPCRSASRSATAVT